ncbi:microtubule-associated serine/threonine-protein kinase 2 [Plakobranchus ocellatus]|uniref:Microtubule-associated serine/threonine-protein kinase 2 n=1 Tax=Plakobranchus ocellatus TaxID=259542 RepID=A0AAV3YY01_9GAST|nr:microtubule-associated serine/threonine-protein kinase 2 [Plakobranchus ocellatus]
MSFKRSGPRRSLPSLPTNLTNKSSCRAEFHVDAQEAMDLKLGRVSPIRVVTSITDNSGVVSTSPIPTSPLPSPDSTMGRRSASPTLLRRCNSGRGSPASLVRHQTSAFGGLSGRRSPVHGLLARRPHSASSSCSSGLESVVQQHQATLRRHNSSTGCCALASSSAAPLPYSGSLNSQLSFSSSGNIRTLSSDDGTPIVRKHSWNSSCPGTPPGGASASGRALANLHNHLLQRVQLQHLQKRHLTSDSSASSDTDDPDTEVYISGPSNSHSGANSACQSGNTSGRSSPRQEGSIYSRGAGLVHQGSIPCSHSPGSKCSAHRLNKHNSESDGESNTLCSQHSLPLSIPSCTKSIAERSNSPTAEHTSTFTSVTEPSPPSSAISSNQHNCYPTSTLDSTSGTSSRAGRLRRQLSLSRSMSGTLSPSQLSPSSSLTSLFPPTPVACTSSAALNTSGPQISTPGHHPPLQRNESMIYEEDVPVIVRRRGCLLRVRITSFIDPDSPSETAVEESKSVPQTDYNNEAESEDQDPSTPSSGLVTPVPSDFHSPGPTSPLQSPMLRKCRGDDLSFGGAPGGLRRLQRTLSEDTKQRRRESMPSTPTAPQPPPVLAHNVSALIEPTNLLRMKSTLLGQSAPSLTNNLKEATGVRRSSRNYGRKSVVAATSTSPVLPPRCPSPHTNNQDLAVCTKAELMSKKRQTDHAEYTKTKKINKQRTESFHIERAG